MNLAQIEKVAKALADKTRLKIYAHITSRPQVSCGQLVVMRGVSPATVSHHLKILSKAGLIECRRKGQFVLNAPNLQVLEDFTKSIGALAKAYKNRRQEA